MKLSIIKNLSVSKDSKSIVYCCYNVINKKVYIGLTKNTLAYRIYYHYRNHKSNNHFHNALDKYPKENFKWFVIFQDNNINNLKEKEKEYIQYFSSHERHYGYNSTLGGDGITMTDEIKKKISEKAKERLSDPKKNGMYKRSVYSIWLEKYGKEVADFKLLEFKQKCSENSKSKNNSFFNKKHTAESKAKSSKTKKEKGIVPWNKGKVVPIIECPYCKKTGGNSNMTRYHFENCKNKIIQIQPE